MYTIIVDQVPQRFYHLTQSPQYPNRTIIYIVNNSLLGVSQLILYDRRANTFHTEASSVAIQIMTIWTNIGTSSQPIIRAEWSIFVGRGSVYNSSGTLPTTEVETLNRAEIEGVAKAMITIARINIQEPQLKEYKILLCSGYLINGIARRGVDSAGNRLAHFELFKSIWEYFEAFERVGISIQLWNVAGILSYGNRTVC